MNRTMITGLEWEFEKDLQGINRLKRDKKHVEVSHFDRLLEKYSKEEVDNIKKNMDKKFKEQNNSKESSSQKFIDEIKFCENCLKTETNKYQMKKLKSRK